MPSVHAIPTFFGRATTVLGGHANLNAILERLRALSASANAEQAASRSELARLASELDENIRAHFAAEEDEGYFGTIVATFPSLQEEVARLLAEHEEMRVTVDCLRAASDPGTSLGDFHAILQSFWTRLSAHERAESRLMQEFFLHDDSH